VVLSDGLRAVSWQDPGDLRIRRRKDPRQNYPAIPLFMTNLKQRTEVIVRARDVLGEIRGVQAAVEGDSRDGISPYLLKKFGVPGRFHHVITSPPYWDMLRMRGAETQKKRRAAPDLDVHYSDDPRDLGNVADYDAFVEQLAQIYEALYPALKERAYLTIIVKNVKKGGRIYPLAWDLAKRLGRTYTLKDEKIWAQDNQRLAPYGLGNAWVSNTFHHYCLQFRKEEVRQQKSDNRNKK